MTIKRTLTSLTAALALAATTLAPMATSASADPWNGRGGDRGYSHNDRGNWNGRGDRGNWNRGGDRGNWNGRGDGRRDFYAYRRPKHHDNGKYIALGIGALMLGIMASEAGRY